MATKQQEINKASEAHLRNFRMAPRKLSLVASLVRGKSVETALNILRFTPKAAAAPLTKLIKSAVANATDLSKGELDVDTLLVGSYARDGEDLRVSAHLIDAATGEQLWSERIDVKWDRLITLPDHLSGRSGRGDPWRLDDAARVRIRRSRRRCRAGLLRDRPHGTPGRARHGVRPGAALRRAADAGRLPPRGRRH